MKTILFFCLIFPFTLSAQVKQPAKLRYSVQFILEKVLEKKFQTYKPEIPVPPLYYSSTTPLKFFQDIIEKQWGFRPDVITNAYSLYDHMIFLMDDADYYESKGRCLDDSLAHELTHYVQDQYLHWDFND